MKLHKIASLILLVGVLNAPFTQLFAEYDEKEHSSELKYVRYTLQQIIDNNLRYRENFKEHVPESSLIKQTPDATLILCSDSRIDSAAINEKPAGELFVIRNIGNQMLTAVGSVEYGVDHLHTPMLLVVGHSECGAIKAAMGDFSGQSASLRKELSTLNLDPKATLNDNIIKNINNQVKYALSDFKHKLEDKELVVIGMVYDLHNDFKFGEGKLIVVNINGETDPKVLAKNQYVAGLKHLQFLH